MSVQLDPGPFAEQFEHLDLVRCQDHGFHIHRDQMAEDLMLGIFEWDGEIAGNAERGEILVTWKELLNVLCVVAGFALYDLCAGRAIETVFDLILVPITFPKSERTDTGFRKQVAHECVADSERPRYVPDQFPKEIRPRGGNGALDERTKKFVRLVAGFQPLWVVEHRHVIPHVSSVDTQDMGEKEIEARKSSIGQERAATTENPGFLLSSARAWGSRRRSRHSGPEVGCPF